MEIYKRINKPVARQMYYTGCDILLLPCKVSSVALTCSEPWVKPVTINIKTCDHGMNKFDRSVNDFEYYNCNSELGYYSHYYVSSEDFEKFAMCSLMC